MGGVPPQAGGNTRPEPAAADLPDRSPWHPVALPRCGLNPAALGSRAAVAGQVEARLEELAPTTLPPPTAEGAAEGAGASGAGDKAADGEGGDKMETEEGEAAEAAPLLPADGGGAAGADEGSVDAAFRERRSRLRTVLSGEVPIELERQFLARHNHADQQILKNIKAVVSVAGIARQRPQSRADVGRHAEDVLCVLRWAATPVCFGTGFGRKAPGHPTATPRQLPSLMLASQHTHAPTCRSSLATACATLLPCLPTR